jgi:hypothetical protein
MTVAKYHAELDAVVTSTNGTGPRADAVRVDVPGVTRAGRLR